MSGILRELILDTSFFHSILIFSFKNIFEIFSPEMLLKVSVLHLVVDKLLSSFTSVLLFCTLEKYSIILFPIFFNLIMLYSNYYTLKPIIAKRVTPMDKMNIYSYFF
jgi:hypothetical protein